jgi:hypothetical protein
MTKRALGLAGMLLMLLLAKLAGAAEAPMTQVQAARIAVRCAAIPGLTE